jgi:phosphatidylserine/phosphatidylglycerophosphate/cardiolipin synthase-like enzyme
MNCWFLLALLLGCASARPQAKPADPVELVESWPLETTLDHADVWPGMIAAARTEIDLAEFYVSIGPRLEPVIAALEQARARGVRIRILADSKFAGTYPETLERLAAHGASVRRWKPPTGGVLHAKYFLVDGREAYLGSQNFDWRSLEQIQELGVRFTLPEDVRALQDIFELDWALAGGAPRPPPPAPYAFHGATLTGSPRELLPDERLWDLPALVKLLDSARESIKVQVLTYRADVPELRAALDRAAARGVHVQLLISNWVLRHPQNLDGLPGEVRILSIPQLKSGFIPFARVSHAKFCVVDSARAWVGTSNWEHDYFYKSRNVALVLDGGALPRRLDSFFDGDWNSAYSSTPGDAPKPRVGQ